MQRPRGYLVIASFLAVYIALYSIFESIDERQLSRVSSERNVFMTMVSSGKSGSFITTMQTFGPLQNRAVSFKPDFLASWSWFGSATPNKELLALWARNYLETCTTETCGIGDRDSPVNSARIDLRQADQREADLSGARLAEKQLKELRTYECAKLPDNLKHLEH